MQFIRYAIVRIEIEAPDKEAAEVALDNCDYSFVYNDGLVRIEDTEIVDHTQDYPC